MRKITLWILFVLALIAAGCGGGGGGSASGAASIFLTDDLSTNYSAVWVKIFRVELVRQGGDRVTVYEDSVGKVINLRALNDGSPRYAFLGKDGVPEGTYTGVRFTLSKDCSLLPNGSDNTLPRVFDDPYINPSNANQAILTINFSSPKTVTGDSNDFICDFVLSDWTEDGTKVRNCKVEDGPRGGIDNRDRHEHDDWEGTIAELSGVAPDFTFVLRLRSGNSITVTTDSLTAIFNGNGAPNPQLANGKRAQVRGIFTPSTRTVAATSVKIRTGENNGEDPHEAKGLAKEVSAEAGTFDIVFGRAEGFTPVASFVHVTTTETTRFFSHGGVLLTREQFFGILTGGGKRVEAEGTWNADTNTLAAVKAKIEDEDDHHEAEARGAPSNIDADAGTFSLTLQEWEGFSASPGAVIGVETNGETDYRNGDGQKVEKAAFFQLMATATSVKVEGRYMNGVITAKYARIRNSGGGGGGGGQAEARGAVLNLNVEAKTFDLVLVEWSGFGGSANMIVHVAFTEGATFRDFSGESVSREAFFGLIQNGFLVEAEGSFNSGSSTLTAVKAKLEDD